MLQRARGHRTRFDSRFHRFHISQSSLLFDDDPESRIIADDVVLNGGRMQRRNEFPFGGVSEVAVSERPPIRTYCRHLFTDAIPQMGIAETAAHV